MVILLMFHSFSAIFLMFDVFNYMLFAFSLAFDRNIATDFEIADGIVIQADVHCLTRILNNLMSNAQKYTADSFGVKLKQESDRVILCVSNTLADSTSLDIDKVFDPFYRMDARTAGGSGLGLYVVKLLCERLGWSVSAESIDDVFTVSIMI